MGMFPPPITGPAKGATTINGNPFDQVVEFYSAVCEVLGIEKTDLSVPDSSSDELPVINFGDTLFIRGDRRTDPSIEKRITANVDVVLYAAEPDHVEAALDAGVRAGGSDESSVDVITIPGYTRRFATLRDPDGNVVWLVHDEQNAAT